MENVRRAFEQEGIARGYDITSESVIVKLMFLLGQERDKQKISELLSTPLRGEMTAS